VKLEEDLTHIPTTKTHTDSVCKHDRCCNGCSSADAILKEGSGPERGGEFASDTCNETNPLYPELPRHFSGLASTIVKDMINVVLIAEEEIDKE